MNLFINKTEKLLQIDANLILRYLTQSEVALFIRLLGQIDKTSIHLITYILKTTHIPSCFTSMQTSFPKNILTTNSRLKASVSNKLSRSKLMSQHLYPQFEFAERAPVSVLFNAKRTHTKPSYMLNLLVNVSRLRLGFSSNWRCLNTFSTDIRVFATRRMAKEWELTK